jgi:ATP-dependent Clp protease adaptor protein ClpS
MLSIVHNSFTPETEEVALLDVDLSNHLSLVLYNDDVNTFEFVIDCLVEICSHDFIQAEQCAHIVHYKGKCEVKVGAFEELEQQCRELLRRGLSATIE